MSLNEQCQRVSKISESSEFTLTTHERTDLSEEQCAHEHERLKSKRAHSPAPSCMSLKSELSMDPITNVRGAEAYPLDYREKSERAPSPVLSYMSLRTDWSMDPPTNFKDFLLDASFHRGRPERAPSPTPSHLSQIYSDWSAEPSKNCKAEDNFPFNPRLLTDHHLNCPLCKSVLKDPVSILCGHSYCRDCINASWDNCVGVYVCPQCEQASETRPVLNTNVVLAEVVKNLQHAGFSPALPPQSYAGPEDVACDFCTEHRLKAVKSCSTCGAFFCETHIRQHYTIPALQKHTLCDLTGEDEMKMKTSQEHQKTDNSFSDITSEQNQTNETQDIIQEDVKIFFESVLNNSTSETTCADLSRPETEVNKPDTTDVGNLAPSLSNLAVSNVTQSCFDCRLL